MKLRFISVLAISATASAADPAVVDGWTKAKWGMSEQQVLDAFQGQARRDSDLKIIVDGVDLGFEGSERQKKLFTASFIFDRTTARLTGVGLKPEKIEPVWLSMMYSHFRSLLIEKYGKPASEENNTNRFADLRHTSWAATGGTVDLRLIENSSFPKGQTVSILYRETRQKILDKL